MRDSALEVVSMPAKMNVLKPSQVWQSTWKGGQAEYARHLSQQLFIAHLLRVRCSHVSLHCGLEGERYT